jgi:hypothetical protein
MANLNASFAPQFAKNEATIENEHGAQVAFDNSGACVRHSDVQLHRKTLTGWKILEKECPRCRIEWEDRRKASMNQLGGSSHQGMNSSFQNHQLHLQQPRPTPYDPMQPPAQAVVYPQPASFHPPQQPVRYAPQRAPPQQQYRQSASSSPLQPTHAGTGVYQPPMAKIVGVYQPPAPAVAPQMSPPRPHTYASYTASDPSTLKSDPAIRHADPSIPSLTSSLSSMPSSSSSSLPTVAELREEKDAKLQLIAAFKADDIAGVLSIMRKYSQSASVQGIGCKALWRLGLRYGKAAKLLENGGKGVIEQAVSRHAHRDGDIAGHGALLLKLLDQGTSEPELRSSTTTRPSLSSLPPVDWRVEKIAVDDIQYLAKHNALDRLLLLMRWFPRSSVIQGTGCKEIFGLINQAQDGAVVLDRGYQQVIKDAMQYFGAIDDDVAEYGSKVLSMCASTANATTTYPAPAQSKALQVKASEPLSPTPKEPTNTGHSWAAAPSTSARPPVSSLPVVDASVERMAVKSLEGENDVSSILTIMRQYRGSSNIQGHGCKQLWHHCQRGDKIADLYHCDAKEVIKDALYYFGNDEGYVADYGTMLLDRLIEHGSSVSSSSTPAVSNVKPKVEPPKVTARCEPRPSNSASHPPTRTRRPLSSLPRVDPNTELIKAMTMSSYSALGNVDGILSTMRQYPGSGTIQGSGCEALWALRCVPTGNNVEILLQKGTKDVVEDAVFYFGNTDTKVMGFGPMILDAFSSNGTTVAAQTRRPLSMLPHVDAATEMMISMSVSSYSVLGNVDSIIAAMRQYPGSSVIQGSACKALWDLCCMPAGNNVAIILQNIAEALVEDAVYYFGDGDAARYGPLLLDTFARRPLSMSQRPASDVDAADNSGDVGLHNATGSENDEMELVTHLEKSGAGAGAANNSGDAPLHDATGSENKLKIVQFLVEKAGADIHATTIDGETPLDLATLGGYAGSSHVAAYLKSQMTTCSPHT